MTASGGSRLCRIAHYALIAIVLSFALGCTLFQARGCPMGSQSSYMLQLPNARAVSVSDVNRSKLVNNLLGSESLQFRSTTSLYWTDARAEVLMRELTQQLHRNGWQQVLDWGHHQQNALILSSWNKASIDLSIVLFDDLDQVALASLAKNYGISGPVPGSTMLVIHFSDKDQAC